MHGLDPLPAELGEVIGGYRLERVLGRGGMGAVFLGTHVRIGRKGAVKVLSRALSEDPEIVSRFFHEARIVHEVRHANIVDTIDYIETDDPRRVALVMELLQGVTLAEEIAKGPIPAALAVDLAYQMASALTAVHKIEVVHRDLKPANVFIVRDPSATMAPDVLKLLDFGIAKLHWELSQLRHETQAGAILGTPHYMAPEQVRGSRITGAADVYAFGEVLFEMLGGRRLFTGEPMAVMARKGGGEIPAFSSSDLGPEGAAFEAMIRACLAFDPADRPEIGAIKVDLKARRSARAPVVVVDDPKPRAEAEEIPPTVPNLVMDVQGDALPTAALASVSLNTPTLLEAPRPARPAFLELSVAGAILLLVLGFGLLFLPSRPEPKAHPPLTSPPDEAVAATIPDAGVALEPPTSVPPPNTRAAPVAARRPPPRASRLPDASAAPGPVEDPAAGDLPIGDAEVFEPLEARGRVMVGASPLGIRDVEMHLEVDGAMTKLKTPAVVDLTPGRHRIAGFGARGVRAVAYVDVEAGDVRRLRLDPCAESDPRARGWITIRTEGDVRIDGQRAGEAPNTFEVEACRRVDVEVAGQAKRTLVVLPGETLLE